MNVQLINTTNAKFDLNSALDKAQPVKKTPPAAYTGSGRSPGPLRLLKPGYALHIDIPDGMKSEELTKKVWGRITWLKTRYGMKFSVRVEGDQIGIYRVE